jgi:hypothetical protein
MPEDRPTVRVTDQGPIIPLSTLRGNPSMVTEIYQLADERYADCVVTEWLPAAPYYLEPDETRPNW